MSLYNVLRTGVSGMEAQATKLGTVSENIANANTVGYKRADTQFSSLILESSPSSYSSGAVEANVRYDVSRQGALSYTLSKTDLAIQGDGFFVVRDRNGADFLTRAGSFVLDGQSGNLVNAAGFSLLGYPSVSGVPVAVTLNDTAGLEPITTQFMNMRANPSTAGTYSANLDANAPVSPGPFPSANAATSDFTTRSSVLSYDDLGREVTLDIYWTKTAAYDPITLTGTDTWEVTVFNQADADPVSGNFPYADTASIYDGVLATGTVTFDPTTGEVVTAPTPLAINLPGAAATLDLDVSTMRQFAADFEPLEIAVNGNAPNVVEAVSVDQDGRVFAVYGDGTEVEFYRLPLADVPSPDQMTPLPGNVYNPNLESGDLQIALPDQSGMGRLVVSALEQSNVDLGTELTDMIISQRSYTANSKSFQTGNQLLEVLVNLVR